ncbi:MAG: hypothetical protein JWO31_181 [Phycisphaerales bacterium]|nr:hypothetical protein [Phycisphaerales bacterium]
MLDPDDPASGSYVMPDASGLQAAMDAAYDRAGYDADTDYSRPPVPPLNPDDATWAAALLAARASATAAGPLPASNPTPDPLP